MGSSGEDESFLYGDGVLSDLEDGTSTVESFEQRSLQDYIVKKDMLESPATSTAIAPPVVSTNLDKERRPSPVQSESNFTTKSEEDEERRKNEVMIPNPYVVRPAYSSSSKTNQVFRSSNCVLEPTDSSAATLAQRINIEGNDPIVPMPVASSSVTGKQQGMIPKVSLPAKSWWRASEGKEQRQAPWAVRYSFNQPSKAAATAAIAAAAITATAATTSDAANTSSEDEDTFGPASSDGWDPADSEMGSLGTFPEEEDMFKPTVENKTEQTFLKNSLKNESARAHQAARQPTVTSPQADDNSKPIARVTSGNLKTRNYTRKDTPDVTPAMAQPTSGFLTHVEDDVASISSEESDVLKFDSEQDLL